MPAVALCPTAGVLYQAFTSGGEPLNGGLLYTYIAGGTTPQATYTTVVGNVQNTNPIQLNSDGRPPNEIWLVQGVAYRFDLYTAAGSLIKTYDNVSGINDFSSISAAYLPIAGGTVTGNVGIQGTLSVTGVITAVNLTANRAVATSVSNALVSLDAPITSSLAANVSMTATTAYFTILQVTQAQTGTWLATAQATVVDVNGPAAFHWRITDGTTVFASGRIDQAVTSSLVEISGSALCTSPVGNIRMAVQDPTSTGGSARANISGDGKDCTLTVLRVL